jgi:hypothetical protein
MLRLLLCAFKTRDNAEHHEWRGRSSLKPRPDGKYTSESLSAMVSTGSLTAKMFASTIQMLYRNRLTCAMQKVSEDF